MTIPLFFIVEGFSMTIFPSGMFKKPARKAT
jgi:hypothetical protein